jgi:Tat protein secretion system quality control protein TatD with DNase activity
LVGATIAQVKGIETSELAEASTRNACAMFAL